MLVLLVAGCSSKKTSIQGATGGELSNNGFPASSISNANVVSVIDPFRDWSFYDGKTPGRHDAYVDIHAAFLAFQSFTGGHGIDGFRRSLGCGGSSNGVVVCTDTQPALPAGEFLLFSMRLNGNAPTTNAYNESGRYSVFIDAGGDPSTKAEATAESPDLSIQGANLVYQVVFGHPGVAGSPGDKPSIELSVSDRRTSSDFVNSAVRVWLHGRFVFFVIPMSEIGDQFNGVRGAAFWGSAAEQGNAALGNQDVVPGGVHGPYRFAHVPAPKGPAPSSQAADDRNAIKQFFDDLGASSRTAAGLQHLVATLNRAVIDRYGLDQCQSFLGTTVDATANFEVLEISGPSMYDYTSDGQTTTVDDVFDVKVRRTQNGQTADQTVHVAREANGSFSWFTRCATG